MRTTRSVGMYAIQAVINNNWSRRDFSRYVVLGAVTGAVSGGLGQVFSTGGIFSAVGNGALVGAGTGGVTALITGQNFLEGVVKGAVIGAAVAGISYTVNYYATGSYKTKYFSRNSILGTDEYKYDSSVSKETMQNNINDSKSKNFSDGAWGVSDYTLGDGNSNGFIEYLDHGKQTEAWGMTTPKNFKTGLSQVTISPIAAQNPNALFLTMTHETGHAYFAFLGLGSNRIDTKLNNIRWEELSDTEHFAIYKLENFTATKNSIPIIGKINNVRLSNFFKRLAESDQNLINATYKKLLPVFNRVMK